MKKIEQAAKEYFEEYGYNERSGEDLAFKAGVEFAQRWIQVDDGLPENGELVLVAINNLFIDVVCARLISGKWICRLYIPTGQPDFIIEDKVTHWRPIEYK